jgi:LytS/YehU family sensor histidine kinase
MIIIGFIIGYILDFLIPVDPKDDNKFFHYLSSILITAIVWEGNLWIDAFLDRKYPWIVNPKKRILIHLPLSFLYSAVAIYISMLLFDHFVCDIPQQEHGNLVGACILMGLIVTLTILSIEIGAQFFSQWKKSLIEVEKYKTESVQAQLQNLKNQVNPHFLFNNLSVLSSLVYKDQDKAVDFINQLSKVYRYLLDNRSTELITLEEELLFINSYTYLLKIRFDTNIHFDIDVPKSQLDKLIPPMSLQMLIENAIKHNEVSSQLPLTVSIKTEDAVLEVINNYQPRTVAEKSSGTGLQNIKDRYKYYTNKEVKIESTETTFIVRIPLLNRA